MTVKYKVIKEIPVIWESGAKVGDILVTKYCYGGIAVTNNGKAVCDVDCGLLKEHCKKVS